MRLAALYGAKVSDLPEDIGDAIGFIDGITKKSKSGAVIFDQGKTITATAPSGGELAEDAIRMMVAIAKMKGWESVELDGPPEFKAAAARLLEASGIRVINQHKESKHVDFYSRKSSGSRTREQEGGRPLRHG